MTDFSVEYVKNLVDDLKQVSRDQAKSMAKLTDEMATMREVVSGIGTSVDGIKKNNERVAKEVKEHEDRIRGVEIHEARCDYGRQIKGVWKNINRLNALMDLIKQDEDNDINTGMIDVHEQRMMHMSEIAMDRGGEFKAAMLKMLPWFIVVFVVGIALATIVVFQVVSGDDTKINVPQIEIKK